MSSDLHIHTSASDGRLSPREVIRQAKAAGLRYIAITDHDTVKGLYQLQKDGLYPNKEIIIIPGIEFSAHMPTHEVHILGLNIDISNRMLQSNLQKLVDFRWQRLKTMLEKMQALGYAITEEEILAVAGNAESIGRAHLARVLVEKKFFESIGEVFDQLLYKDGPAYASHYKLEIEEIISLVHHAGGLAVLAHPGLVGDDEIVGKVIKSGIDGLEVFHPKHTAEEVQKYQALAETNRLIVTGGSDFHAIPKRYPNELGVFTVDDSYAEQFIR
ncbi:PHP domain-containing protein [Anaerosinus massiliensis]|uniref:PHP domain-containing protein n=1 Tax=Massilibacillus massiliensis TaxID=1806837 RepID=UPI000A92C5BF|nr:PHP domain-containing protein [Massilibacillus massiliensis]